MTAEQSASGWATLERARAAALTIAEQRQLSDADPAAYERYLVRRATEHEAMPDAERRATRNEYFAEVVCLGLRAATADPEQLERLIAEERARVASAS